MEDLKPKVKDQILHLLKMQGCQTAAALATQLGVSSMAIRQHLQALKSDALVTYQEEKRPLGRPVKLWSLTEQSANQFADGHADLLVDLIRGIETVFGSTGLQQLVAERSQRQLHTYHARLGELGTTGGWQTVVGAIAQIRNQEGYMAEVIPLGEDAVLLVENHCPICTAARTCQLLCHAELEVFRRIFGPAVTVERVEHIIQGDRRCAYRIQSI